MENQIVMYQADNGQTSIEVRLENENVWLSANQMSVLFDRDEKTIRKHINNVFSEKELVKENNTHFLRVDGVKQPLAFYSLDVIISVGYRVKSQRGVQFRQWANKVLKAYLLKGFVVNEKIRKRQIGELRQLVQMLGRTIQNQTLLKTDENQALFDIVVDYTYALDTLDDYDYQRLGVKETTLSSPRTIRSATATNALRPPCFFGSSTTMVSSTARTAASALPTTPWLP